MYAFTDAVPSTDPHGESGISLFIHARDVEAVLFVLDGAGCQVAQIIGRRIRSAAALARIPSAAEAAPIHADPDGK